jgi:hypothetical protein
MQAPGKPDTIQFRPRTRCVAVVDAFGVSWG